MEKIKEGNNYKLYNADCLDIMSQIKDKFVDLILCDLPYGTTENKEDIRIPFDLLWKEYNRIIKDKGCIILYAQGLFYVDLINSNRKMFRYDLVWNKVLTTGFLNAKKMPLRQHEQVAVFYKRLPTYNPQFTEGPPQHSKGSAYLDKDIVNQNYGKYNNLEDSRKGNTEKYPTSIITIQKPSTRKAKHRTEKPIKINEYFIKTYTNEGDTVLDNCMGAGNCGVAAISNNRCFIGIEKNESIFNIAVDNITKKGQSQ